MPDENDPSALPPTTPDLARRIGQLENELKTDKQKRAEEKKELDEALEAERKRREREKDDDDSPRSKSFLEELDDE